MKLFISQLRQIIVEETKEALQEMFNDDLNESGDMVSNPTQSMAARSKEQSAEEQGVDASARAFGPSGLAEYDEIEEEKDNKWIQKAVPEDDPDRGKFSAAAKKAGMDTCAYAKRVVNDDSASEKQKARAQFALNTGCKKK